ncbi:STAS domain-containing protein [Candidatus Peregrinibacteria bacterium]|nr:STAS domain-containing protein [Candidatus Peregrinibacteria bacterium]
MALIRLQFVTNLENQKYGIVEFHGELDKSNLAQTEKDMSSMLETFSRQALIFDLSDLHYVNSEGIGFIVSIHVKLSKLGKQLALCGLRDNVSDVLEAVGMDRLIPTYRTVDEAVAALGQ